MIKGCTHDDKVLFSSKDLELDLRYLAYCTDDSDNAPEIKLEIDDQSHRGLLGPSCKSHFELEEGQCVVFVLRQVDGWEYQSELHQEIANPDSQKIKEIGIDRHALFEATSSLRPPENPLMTKVSSLLIRANG